MLSQHEKGQKGAEVRPGDHCRSYALSERERLVILEQNTQHLQLRIQFFRTAIEEALVFEVIHDGDMDL